MLIRRSVSSWLILVALPLAVARCGSDDDSAPAAAAGAKAGGAGKGAAGAGHGGGSAKAGKGGQAGQSEQAGQSGAGQGAGEGGVSGSAAASGGQAGEAVSSGSGNGPGGEPGGGGAGGTGGSAGASEAGTSGEGGAGAEPVCSEYPYVSCSGTLEDVGAGDFEIDFSLTTTATVGSAIVGQRATCGTSDFWNVRLVAGTAYFELDDVDDDYVACSTHALVNDGVPHWISVRRVADKIRLYVDCELDTECDSIAHPVTLAALQTGTSVCVGVDGTVDLVGTVKNVCVGRP